MIFFVAFINLLFLAILYSVRNIPGVNPYFLILHIFGMIMVSLVYLYVIMKEKFIYYDLINLVRKSLILLVLCPAVFFATILASTFPYGSIFLLFITSIVAGFATFIFLKDQGKEQIKIKSSDYWNNALNDLRTGFGIKITRNIYSLFLIFLFGFFLRFLVFGLPKVPIGCDIPMYLLQAVKGSQMPFSDLVTQGLSFTSNPYLDTINFATLWLGIIAKFLNMVGLDQLLIPKIIMPLINSLSILALYFLVKSLTNKEIALYSSLIFATLPGELMFSDLYKEIFGKFWLLIALCFFIKYIKRRSYFTVAFLLISIFFLWKTAITAFAKTVMFLFAYTTYFTLSKKITRAELIAFCFVLLILSGIVSFIYRDSTFLMNYIPNKSINAQNISPYTYYAFPIIALTNLTAFLITIFYFFRAYTSKDLSKEENSAISLSLPIFVSLFVFSFLISTLLGYHVFPSSLYLYNLRFSLYMDIPLAIMAGLFLYNITKKIGQKTIKALLCIIVILLTFMDYGLTAYKGTTIHEPRLTPFISNDAYNELRSLDIKEYDTIICYGKFAWAPDASNFGFGNWLKYLIYSEIGKEPTTIESLADLENINFEANEKILVLDCQEKDIKQAFIYNHKKRELIEIPFKYLNKRKK